MNSTLTPTPPKSPDEFSAHLLDRRNPAEVDGEGAKVGDHLLKAAHQPIAALGPDLARPELDAMVGSALDEIRPSLGKRASRALARF